MATSLTAVIVDNALYHEGVRVPLDDGDPSLGHARVPCGRGDFQWVGLHDPTDEELRQIATTFDLHPLAVEDAGDSHQRPKVERYGDTLFLVLKTLWYVDEDDAVETGEINLFIGPDFVVTVRHGQGIDLSTARRDLEQRAQVLEHGPMAVMYAICDRVVDEYEKVGASLEIDVDEVEESVFSPARTDDSVRIYTLKREIAEVRRAVMPLREPMRRFAHGRGGGHRRGDRHLLPRRRRPPPPGLGGHRQPRRAAVHRVRRAPGPHLGPAERGHAQDLRRRRARRRTDAHRRDLRHELRPDARAAAGPSATRSRSPSWSACPGVLLWFFKKSGWL